MFTRSSHNPLIVPGDIQPSRPDFEVIGTFNAGVTTLNGEVILLIRVAERPIAQETGYTLCPYLSENDELVLGRIKQGDPDYDLSDSRQIYNLRTGQFLLTSISHLRLARSSDGVNFVVEDRPWLRAQPPHENYGVEDPRITRIGDVYYVNYTAVSKFGIATGLVSTRDFINIERHGIIFPPANRDVTIFPELINGLYTCYHRPMPGMFGGMHIWLARSPDLKHWGQHRIVLEAKRDGWEAGRVGSGAPPLRTEQGWLSIYHAADKQDRYCLGAFLTPLDEPDRVIARSHDPILVPLEDYEVDGFFGQVVFACGAILKDNEVLIYYGAADERIALVQAPLDPLLTSESDRFKQL
jgi:beta-1,2-mannobiose phosphorylase / 1,2-beta-oligomannan phosphorylase